MEGSALANTTRRQASGADTALSNAITSVTVSQQESEGQASEPAAGSTGEPQSPRAARSQVSTAVSFEGARAAGSAVQPERSVDEDSALSAAEADGPVRSNRLLPRPANSLISTAVHPTIRNTNNGSKLTVPPQHHPLQQHQPQALLQHQHQQADQQQQQQLQQQQQRYALPTVLNRGPYGRGPGPNADHYASSPEVQRPHSITSQAVETRGDGHGHAGRSAAEQGAGPFRGLRTHPTRSNARGATPASVYGQIQAPGGVPGGPSSPRKDRQHSLQWANAIAGGSVGAGGMDPAAAAAAAAAAFLGNGLVGGWGLMQGLGQGGAGITAAGHSQSAIPHSLLAAAAVGASGALPLQASPFNLAALGRLQLQAASHMQQQAAAGAGGVAGLNGASGAGLLWQPSEQADSVPGDLPPPAQGAALQAAAPASSPQTGPEQSDQFLTPPRQQQLVQWQMPPVVAVGGGVLASSNLQDTADGGRGGGGGGDRVGTAPSGAGTHGQQVAMSSPPDSGASRHRHRQGRHSYGMTAAAYLGPMYGGAQSSVHPFALADMHELQGLLMSASMSAAAAAAAAAGGTGGSLDDGAAVAVPPGSVRVKAEQQQTRGSSRSLTANTNGLQTQQQQYHYGQQPAGDSHQQPEALLFSTRGYGHGSQYGEVAGTGTAANAAVMVASSEAGMLGLGAADAVPAATLQAMAVAEPVATTTATSACGGDHGTVVDGGAVAVVPQGAGTAAPHPTMQLYVPVILPLDLVSAQMAITQAAAAAAAVASAANHGASPCDVGGVGPATAGGGGSDKVLGGNVADGRGGAGSRDLLKAGAAPAVTAVHSTQALNTSPQHFMDFEHESAQQNVPGASTGARIDGGGDGGGGLRSQAVPGAAASVARGGGGGAVIPASSGHGRLCVHDGRAGGGAVASIAATPLGNGVSPALSQHSAGSNPGAGDAGGGADSPEHGLLGRAALAAPAGSVETVTASVATPGGPGGAVLPPFEITGGDNPSAAAGGGGPGGMSVAAAVPAAQGAGFGGLAVGGNANQHNHNNNIAINAHSNAYGAGPSMTQTADYRSHLQVALSLLLQATSAAYNSQRQSGVAGANEGSGIFVAAAQQASASNAVGQEMSDGMDGSGAGAGGGAIGVGSGTAGGAGIVSSGGGRGRGGGLDGSGTGAGRGALGGGVGGGVTGNGCVGLRDGGGGANPLAAAVAAHSMHGVAMGIAAAATAEPMDTEGQVVDQAIAASHGFHGSEGPAATGNLREIVAGTTPGLADDGGGGGGLSESPEAYQAPQWSTQRGGGGGGGGARSAMHGSSAGGGTGPHGHHGHVAHHHHSHHHPQGLLQSPAGYHHHRGNGAGSASGSGKIGVRVEGYCSPGVAQLEGALSLGCGEVAGTAAAGASVGSAGGAVVGDGEQADNNSALQMDEAGHPAASVHATVIAEESDASEGGGCDDSGSMEVPPAAAARGLDGGGGATGTGGGIAAGVGSSKAAAVVVGMREIVSQRFDGSRSRSREGQASKQPHDQLMKGPPTAGPGLGEVASHRAEMRSPARHDGGVPDPRDSSMGMAAGPSHDGTDSGSNGATTSDTVDMAEDSRMGSASEHGDSGIGTDPRDMMQTGENLLPLDEHGGENVGIGGGEDVEERGDDNDNAGSADGGDDGGAENAVAMDCDLDGDGDGGARVSVGPAAALLGTLGGGGGGASTGHIGPVAPNNGKGSPADKVASHHPDRPDHLRHHLHHPGGHHHPHLQTVSKEATGGGGVRASTSGTARNAHHHHHAGPAGAVMYAVSAVAALVGAEGDGDGGDGMGPAASGAPAGAGAGGAVPTEALDDRGSPAPQALQLQAANSTAMGSMRHGHGIPRRPGGVESGGLRAVGANLHPYPHTLRDDRWPAPTATAPAIAGVGPAFSASNADRQNAGGNNADGCVGIRGVAKTQQSAGATAQSAGATAVRQDSGIDGGCGSPDAAAADELIGRGSAAIPVAMEGMEMVQADMKSSSQEAAGSVRHRHSPSEGLALGQHLHQHLHHQLSHRSQDRAPQLRLQRLRSGGESAPRVDPDAGMSTLPPLHAHHHQLSPPLQQHQQLAGAHAGQQHGQQTVGPALSQSQQVPLHHTQPGAYQHQHHLQQEALNANENTTLAALGVGADLHQTSVLTTASQPPPLLPPLLPPDGQQLLNDTDATVAMVGSGGMPATAQAITHGSAGRGDGLFIERMSQEAVPQVTEIHGTFPGMAATAAEALALHQQEERLRLAAAAAETVAAVAATAADAQASWQGKEDRQPSGSPGGPSLSAVMPQFTEVHGAFTRTAGTAAEAQASGMLLRGEAEGAGGANSGGNMGAADPQVGELGRQSTSQAGARLTAPRDAEVVGVSGTPATAGGGGGADGSASPQPGQAEGRVGAAALPFHRSNRQLHQQHASADAMSGGGVRQQQHHHQTIIHRTAGGGGCAAAAAAAESSGGGDYEGAVAAGVNGPPALGTAAGGENYTKAESALHLTPASRALSRGVGDGMITWTFCSGRVRGGHDGFVGPSVAARADGGGGAGGTRDAAPGSVDGHGSNGIAPLEPYGDEDGIATAAVSQSGEVMLPPAVGGDFAAVAGDAIGGLAPAGDVQGSSRRGDGFIQQLHGAGPAMSGVASRGGAIAGGCGATGFGAITPETRRLPRYGLALTGRGMPSWVQHQVSPPQYHPLQSQQQLELQALQAAGVGSGGGGGGHQLQHAQVADGPLSTQAAAYGGYDDEYDSDGERRRAEGPPQPQMTILVTSHAANSHHTVSGGTAVVSEADNGIAGAGPGDAGNSPAVAAWEEEFDGPHRPPGGDATQQQGSWRGGDCMGGMGGDGTKSTVMSSSRADPHAYPRHSAPQGHHTCHHQHHLNHPSHNHPQQTPHVFPTRSAVFGEQAPDPSPTPQQQEQMPQEQQQQPSTGRCAWGQHGPSRQRRGGDDAGADETPSGAGGGAGKAEVNLMESDDGEAAGPAGGTKGGIRSHARGRRGARGRTRGEKRKRAHESADHEEGRRSARTGGGSSGVGSGRGGRGAAAGDVG